MDRVFDRLAVLRRQHAQRDQDLDLGEAVLVQLRGPLAEQHDGQAEAAPAAHELVGRVQHLAGLDARHLALGREEVRLVDHQVQREGLAPFVALCSGGPAP